MDVKMILFNEKLKKIILCETMFEKYNHGGQCVTES